MTDPLEGTTKLQRLWSKLSEAIAMIGNEGLHEVLLINRRLRVAGTNQHRRMPPNR